MKTLYITAFSSFNDDYATADVAVRETDANDVTRTIADCSIDVSTFAADVANGLPIDETALEAHIVAHTKQSMLWAFLPSQIDAMPRAIEFFDAS